MFFALYIYQCLLNLRMASADPKTREQSASRAYFSLFCGVFALLELIITYLQGSQPYVSLIYSSLYTSALLSTIFYMKSMRGYYCGGNKFVKAIICSLALILIPHLAASVLMMIFPSFDYFSWSPFEINNPILAASWGQFVFTPSIGFALMAAVMNIALLIILLSMLRGYYIGNYKDKIILFGVVLSICTMTYEMVTSTYLPEYFLTVVFIGNYPEVARVTFLAQKKIYVQLGLEIEKNKRLAAIKQREIEQAKFRAVSSLATGIAHEINNPLTVISIASSLLKRAASKESADKETILRTSEKLRQSVERMANTVQSLQVLGKTVTAGREKPYPFSAIIDDLKGVVISTFKKNGVNFDTVYINCSESDTLYCDKVKIVKALYHLVENALEAAVKAEEKWVRLEISKNESEDLFRVVDSGGRTISREIKEKMFDPFFTTKEVGAGAGLGLSAAKSLIEENLGTLVHCEQSPNTCFIVSLKRHEAVS